MDAVAWTYTVVNEEPTDALLNDWGKGGWELVSAVWFNGWHLIFKRPK